ncbi:MAG: threonine/serine exporter family protein [Nibricoccus sp.]
MTTDAVMSAPISESTQQAITTVCADTGLLLLQHGAESALVESVARRLGKALGVDAIEVALMANGITLMTVVGDRHLTTVRRNQDRGIQMHVVTEVQRTMLLAEEKKLDLPAVIARLKAIEPKRYPRWLVSLMIGLACACFARLNLLSNDKPMDWGTCGLTFIASAVAMQVRQYVALLHVNPLVNFAIAAFVATSISAQGAIHNWVANPKLTMSSCILLFVPGFPLINAISDMVKGYVNTGISRGTHAILLLLASCVGIILAMNVWKAWTWL